jgi:hypothetical protein
MKLISYGSFIALLQSFCYGDAGFNIGRPKAPCFALLTGIDKLPDFEFIKKILTWKKGGYNDYNSSYMPPSNGCWVDWHF